MYIVKTPNREGRLHKNPASAVEHFLEVMSLALSTHVVYAGDEGEKKILDALNNFSKEFGGDLTITRE